MALSARRVRLLEAIPLLLVALLAAGVVAVTVVILERTATLRANIAVDGEAFEALVDTAETAVSRQAVSLQSLLISGDPSYRRDFAAARAVEDSVWTRLPDLAGRIDPSVMGRLSTAELMLRRWHRTQDEFLAGTVSEATYRDRLDAQSGRFLDVLEELHALKLQANHFNSRRRAEIARLQELGALLTAILALATVVSAAVAYRFRGGIRESGVALVARAREAEAAVRTRDEVLAIVSHDLRNALNAVSGAVELAREESLAPEARAAQLALAERSARGMGRLISDLLDVARIEAGKLSVEPRPEPVHELLAQSEVSHATEAERKGVALVVTPPEGPVYVQADGERVAQVLGNLVGNALKFTPEGGTVMLETEAKDGRVRFTVADTGPGIPEDHLPHIFDRFYQVRASGRAGAGLGLSIARGIVEAHGAELEVESEPGSGTTFSFSLPVAEPPAAG